jgi:hypothetical protein
VGFGSLQHIQGTEVHITRARPPATFRLQGLATLLAGYSLRARAGFVSRRRRSWDSPFGAFSSCKVPVAFPRSVNPRTVSPIGIPVRQSGRAGPTGRGSWDLTLARVPGDRRGLTRPPLDAPLGFRPSRACNQHLAGISPGLLPRASQKSTSRKTSAGTPEYRSVQVWSTVVIPEAGNTRDDCPFRVLAPVRSGTLKRGNHPGY